MFTGLIEAVGELVRLQEVPSGRRLEIRCPFREALKEGDSIAVNGVCLTAAQLTGDGFVADVMAPTLRDTILGHLKAGDSLNLERALRYGDRLDGHLVTGHVDGIGTVEGIRTEGDTWHVRFHAPEPLRKYLAAKGSVAIDGISLTIQAVTETGFEVGLIPHTRRMTTLERLKPGKTVNLECDILARYIERLLGAEAAKPSMTLERLSQLGY